MKRDVFLSSVKNFLELDIIDNIKNLRSDAEYSFDFIGWKAMVFGSYKLEFVFQYLQGIFKWLKDNFNMDDYQLGISIISQDRYLFEFYFKEEVLLNCTFKINIFSNPLDKQNSGIINEIHYFQYKITDAEIIKTSDIEQNIVSGEEGFESFIKILLTIINKKSNFESLPIYWEISFEEKNQGNSRLRMQVEHLRSQHHLQKQEQREAELEAQQRAAQEAVRQKSEPAYASQGTGYYDASKQPDLNTPDKMGEQFTKYFHED